MKKVLVRDLRFDGLRTVGLLAIILAHVNPPGWIFQLRNFDVPLMVFISGAVYSLSSSVNKPYFSYIFGRIRRLVYPTWIFLSIFFLYVLVSSSFQNQPYPFSAESIVSSYELLDGIGYVWVIRVFLLVALIAPFMIYLYKKIKNKEFYLLILVLIYFFYEFVYYLYNSSHNFILENFIFYLIPYACVAGLGIYISQAKKKSVFFLMIGFMVIYFFLYYYFNYHPTQEFKYPPRIYYLSYALFVTLLLYIICLKGFFSRIFYTKLMQFIAKSTLWIYLWHILFIYIWTTISRTLDKHIYNFAIEYIFVLSGALLVTYIQKKLV